MVVGVSVVVWWCCNCSCFGLCLWVFYFPSAKLLGSLQLSMWAHGIACVKRVPLTHPVSSPASPPSLLVYHCNLKHLLHVIFYYLLTQSCYISFFFLLSMCTTITHCHELPLAGCYIWKSKCFSRWLKRNFREKIKVHPFWGGLVRDREKKKRKKERKWYKWYACKFWWITFTGDLLCIIIDNF